MQDLVQLATSDTAQIISLIASILTILTIVSSVIWALFKKGHTLFSKTVIQIFAYAIKTAFCIFIGALSIPAFALAWTFSFIAPYELFPENLAFIAYFTGILFTGGLCGTLLLTTWASVYTSSSKPFERLSKALRQET